MGDSTVLETSNFEETQKEREGVSSSPISTPSKPLTTDDLEHLEELETDMRNLHDSLTGLLREVPTLLRTPSSTSPPVNGITEEELKLFRSRVARRIYLYSLNIREHHDLVERLSVGELRNKSEQFDWYHQEHLTRFKKGMSGWWKNIERHFHQLRMASLLSKEDLDDDGASQIKQQLKSNGRTGWIASLRNTASLSGSKVTAGLRDIKHAMQVEVEKMEAAGRVLVESSQKLEQTDSLFAEFGSHLSAARKKLHNLKRRIEMDSTYVWWAFVFFVSICFFIIAKRTRILRISVWIINKGLTLIIFLVKTICSAIASVMHTSSDPAVPRHPELRSLTSNFIEVDLPQVSTVAVTGLQSSTPSPTMQTTVQLIESMLQAHKQRNTVITSLVSEKSWKSDQQRENICTSDPLAVNEGRISDGSTMVSENGQISNSDSIKSKDVQSSKGSEIKLPLTTKVFSEAKTVVFRGAAAEGVRRKADAGKQVYSEKQRHTKESAAADGPFVVQEAISIVANETAVILEEVVSSEGHTGYPVHHEPASSEEQVSTEESIPAEKPSSSAAVENMPVAMKDVEVTRIERTALQSDQTVVDLPLIESKGDSLAEAVKVQLNLPYD